jgi:hypothetical protein
MLTKHFLSLRKVTRRTENERKRNFFGLMAEIVDSKNEL